MAGSTSGGISDLSLMMKLGVDQTSLSDAMKTMGDVQSKMSAFRAERGIEVGSGGGLQQQKASALFNVQSEEQARRSNLVAASSKIKAIEAEEAAAIAAAARMTAAADAQYEREVKEAVDAYSRIIAERDKAAADAEKQAQRIAAAADAQYEREVKEAVDAYSRIIAEQDKAAADRLARSDKAIAASRSEAKAISGDMDRAHVRVMDTMERINHEYDVRQDRINSVIGLTRAETAALHKQNDVIRAGNIKVETERGNLADVGGFAKAGTRIQEFGRGFEDFTVGFSMAKTNIEGIAMGLRGSANNAAQLAASFDPMAGAAVAIGASLATVIVPMVARWLFDSKELERSAERHKKMLEEMGQDEIKRAKDIAEFRQGGQKTADDPVSKLEALDKKKQESILNAAELRRQLAVAEQQLDQTTFDKQQALWEQGEAIRSGDLAGFGRARGRSADAAGRNEMAEKKRDEIQKALAEEEQAMLAAGRTEKEIKERFGKEIDTAKANRADAEWAKIREEEDKKAAVIMERLDKQNDKAEKDGMKRIEEEFREEQANIDALNVHEDTTKKATAANKASRDAKIAKEQEKRDIKAIDAQIRANADQQDALKESMEKAGNAAGPSAALVSGTQAAESAINRALSGSQSVEGTMKSQLKVLQEIHKDLQKQKQAKTVSL